MVVDFLKSFIVEEILVPAEKLVDYGFHQLLAQYNFFEFLYYFRVYFRVFFRSMYVLEHYGDHEATWRIMMRKLVARKKQMKKSRFRRSADRYQVDTIFGIARHRQREFGPSQFPESSLAKKSSQNTRFPLGDYT